MSEPAYPWMVSNIWPQAQMFRTWREAMDFASGYNITFTNALNTGEIDEYWRVVTKGGLSVEIRDAVKNPGKLMLAGDWHGNTDWAHAAIEHAYAEGCDTILQLGDFGFWIDGHGTDHYLRAVQEALEHFDITLYWLDGNHEDHGRLKRVHDEPKPIPTAPFAPRVQYLPRGFQWEWFGKTWMSVGGAASVDRNMRTPGKSWWPEEVLTDEQVEYCCRGPVDVIVSHDCPAGVNIPGLGGDWPPYLLHEGDLHRRKLRAIWDKTGATELYHGHYHRRYDQPFGDGLVVGLDCDGSTMRDNTLVY